MDFDQNASTLHDDPHRPGAYASAATSLKESDRAFVVALARGLEVLNCFQGGDTLLTGRDIARRCKLSRPILARLTHTLTALGYLQYDEHAAAYRLGTASITLAGANLTQHDVRRMAQPWLEALAEFSRADVALAVRDRMNMVCIQVCRSRTAVTRSLDIGSRIPMAHSATGRAYLTAAPIAERNALLVRLRDADEYTWPRTKEVLDAASREYFRTGFCIALEEWQQGVNEIALAVCPGSGLPGMVIAVCGSAPNLPSDYLRNEIGPRLLALAKKLPTPLSAR